MRLLPGYVLICIALASCGQTWTDGSGRTLTEYPGPGHCEMEEMTFLSYEGTGYVRDPDNQLEESEGQVTQNWDGDTTMPDDASFTGFKKGDAELWRSPSVNAVFVKTPSTVELWPESFTGCG